MHGWLCMGSCQLTWAGAEETNRCVDQFDVSEIGALEHGSDVVGIVGFATWRGVRGGQFHCQFHCCTLKCNCKLDIRGRSFTLGLKTMRPRLGC